jgi:MoaD family protein
MKLKIKLLKPFSDIVGKRELEIDFEGDTLKDLLNLLVERYSPLLKEFYTEKGELADSICVIINDKPLSALDGMDTGLKNGDEVLLFVAVSGG